MGRHNKVISQNDINTIMELRKQNKSYRQIKTIMNNKEFTIYTIQKIILSNIDGITDRLHQESFNQEQTVQ